MFSTFITSLKLQNTCKVNKIISLLKNTSIGNKFPNKLYSNKRIKLLGFILNLIKSVITLFGGKIILLFAIYLIMNYLSKEGIIVPEENTFLHILICLYLCEGFIQSSMFIDGEDKFYAIVSLKMNAKEYVLSNYFWKMFLRFISLVPAMCIVGKIAKISANISILLAMFSVFVNISLNNLRLKDYSNNKRTMQKILYPIAIICAISAYLLPVIHITISITLFKILFIIVFIYGIYSFFKLQTFNNYYEIYKKILMPESKEVENEMQTFNIKKQNNVNIKQNVDRNKLGAEYIHALFITRYKMKLFLPAIIETIITTFVGISIIFTINNEQMVYELFKRAYPFSLYIILFSIVSMSNSNTLNFCRKLFENCDYAMLNFKDFKSKKVIRKLYAQRLKLIMKMNVIPSIIIAIIYVIAVNLCDCMNGILNNLIIFFELVSVSIFITVHKMLYYYIIQPFTYNEILKTASDNRILLNLLEMFALIILFVAIPIITKVSITIYGTIIIIISLLYWILSFKIIDRYAQNTFKLKI